jgi:ribosomal protein L18E
MATMAADSLRRHRLTVADYHQMADAGMLGPDDRVELIAGEVLDRSPIGSLHAAVVAAVAEYFSRVAAGKLTVWSQNPIRLDDLSEPQPDIALVRPIRPRPTSSWSSRWPRRACPTTWTCR